MTDTLPSSPVPSYGISSKKSYRTISANFGDGYSQRTLDGLNTEIESLTMMWSTVTYAEAAIITDFLDAKGGTEAFLFTPPGQSTPKKWACPGGWSFKAQNSSYADVTAAFERVYDL